MKTIITIHQLITIIDHFRNSDKNQESSTNMKEFIAFVFYEDKMKIDFW